MVAGIHQYMVSCRGWFSHSTTGTCHWKTNCGTLCSGVPWWNVIETAQYECAISSAVDQQPKLLHEIYGITEDKWTRQNGMLCERFLIHLLFIVQWLKEQDHKRRGSKAMAKARSSLIFLLRNMVKGFSEEKITNKIGWSLLHTN